MNEKQKQEWSKVRARGYGHFIIRFSIRFGLILGSINFLANLIYLLIANSFALNYGHVLFLVYQLFYILMLAFTPIGLIMGGIVWNSKEKAFLKAN